MHKRNQKHLFQQMKQIANNKKEEKKIWISCFCFVCSVVGWLYIVGVIAHVQFFFLFFSSFQFHFEIGYIFAFMNHLYVYLNSNLSNKYTICRGVLELFKTKTKINPAQNNIEPWNVNLFLMFMHKRLIKKRFRKRETGFAYNLANIQFSWFEILICPKAMVTGAIRPMEDDFFFFSHMLSLSVQCYWFQFFSSVITFQVRFKRHW